VDDAVDLRPLLRRAAEAGNGQAQFDLAFLLRNTARGGADLTESVRWLTKSAESGNVAAMKALADALTQGLGATADKQAAIGWYDKAARGRRQDRSRNGAAAAPRTVSDQWHPAYGLAPACLRPCTSLRGSL
jgi:TPR repeat protein